MFTHWHEVSTIFYISRARSASGCFFLHDCYTWCVTCFATYILLHSCFLLQIEAICFLEKVFIFIQRTNIDNFPCCNCIQSSEPEHTTFSYTHGLLQKWEKYPPDSLSDTIYRMSWATFLWVCFKFQWVTHTLIFLINKCIFAEKNY